MAENPSDGRIKSVSTFILPDEYQRQAAEARRRRRMAEMLAQQAYQPSDISAPIPAAAPLVQGLQAFLAARAQRKADEAEEAAKGTASREARQYLKALTEAPDMTTDAVQPETKPTATVTMPQFEDGRITSPAGIEMGAPAPMIAPQIQLSRYNLTPGQRRAAALEGMLTSENPMVQKIAGAIYPTLQPEKPKLQLGNIDPAKFTPASIATALQEGDVSKLQLNAPEGAAPTEFARLLSERNALPENDPRRAAYDRRIAKETRVPGTTVINTGGRSEPLERIIGPDGKPVLVPRSQAIGKTPAPAPTSTAKMPASVALEIDERQRNAKQYDFGLQRSKYFRNLIENGSLPLSVLSGAEYSIKRALDPSGTSRGSKGEKPAYVLYGELQRFVTQQVNTILQAAKGTQTEGDALRAQQQILDNPNNPAVVLSALEDLERIFKEARQIAIESAESLAEGYETPAASNPVEVDY